MTALVFSDDLLWNWAAEVARITRRHPEWSPERIATEVMSVVTVSRLEEGRKL